MHPLTNAYAFMDFSFQLAARCFCLEEEMKIPDTELGLITHYKPALHVPSLFYTSKIRRWPVK